MDGLGTQPAALGLRERKKQQTRDTIARVALALFAERGYEETTLADIAEAADVSPRTIFAYYESKEDILFCEEGRFIDEFKRMLQERPAGVTTVDAIREFFRSIDPPDEAARLRKQIITDTPGLQMRMSGHAAQLQPILVQSIARDLDAGPDDMRPLLVASSMMAAFMSIRDQVFDAEAAGGEPVDHEQGMALFDQVLDFTRAGLEALQDE